MNKIDIARPTIAAFALAALATMAACSTPTQIHTRDGRAIPTADKPEVDNDSGFVKYEKDGREVQINQSDVQAIEEIK
ncbi:MAG TPA: YgdI/YgdR family lipoprotein [Burkholderiaceae bacterium]|nr:YgdI/YgdR family lipoprotein [Burkholderiaceae bacterium]